jgi:hypothetical protein
VAALGVPAASAPAAPVVRAPAPPTPPEGLLLNPALPAQTCWSPPPDIPWLPCLLVVSGCGEEALLRRSLLWRLLRLLLRLPMAAGPDWQRTSSAGGRASWADQELRLP